MLSLCNNLVLQFNLRLLLANLEGTKVEKGINILEEILRKNKGVGAIISISHQLYGKQKEIVSAARDHHHHGNTGNGLSMDIHYFVGVHGNMVAVHRLRPRGSSLRDLDLLILFQTGSLYLPAMPPSLPSALQGSVPGEPHPDNEKAPLHGMRLSRILCGNLQKGEKEK